jgi:hypothetical protein
LDLAKAELAAVVTGDFDSGLIYQNPIWWDGKPPSW